MFSATMIFAAVYLDHHWVLDVIAGLSYCLVAHLLMRFVFARLGARARARALEGGSREDTPRTALARN
jgi:membrane-associated phospholipid phosphatase